jgi:CHAT domain-containing protein
MLWNVKGEVAHVVNCAKDANIILSAGYASTSATTSDVAEQLESAHLVHIACHGMQDPKSPLQSCFCLSDGSISVEDLMNMDLKNAFLAFLSACETAKGDLKQAEQTIHLAAAMLFVGFKSVIATLWCADFLISYHSGHLHLTGL